jgi:hypothetical protein
MVVKRDVQFANCAISSVDRPVNRALLVKSSDIHSLAAPDQESQHLGDTIPRRRGLSRRQAHAASGKRCTIGLSSVAI